VILMCRLPDTVCFWAAEWPCTSALGDSTRRYSAGSAKRSPLSKLIVNIEREASTRNSVGQPVGTSVIYFRARSASESSRASLGSMIGIPLRIG